MKDNIRPIDFWGIGAPKSGTTWLYHNLKKFYLFYFPPIKELHYFDRSSHYSSPSDLSEAFMIKRIGLAYCLKSIWSIFRCIASKQLNNVFFY